MELLHLGEFIFPICEVRAEVPGELRVHHFHGTGFGIGDEGFFLSAQHVIAQADMASGALFAALLKVSKGTEWQPARIFQVEQCPGKDVVIGKLERSVPKFFSSANDDAYGWEDVHVFGYPESLKLDSTTPGLFQLKPKFLKGYVTRRLESEDVMSQVWAPAYELSFPIPLGVSGSPVFRTGPAHSLLGIALASVDSTLSVYEHTEMMSPTETLRESVRKVEQVGLAARLHDLRDWRPAIAGGRRLGDLY
jgi:hypothetical protein